MDVATRRVRATLDRFLPLVTGVIGQAERRVPRGERVPASQKVLSLFEPHTALVRRGKARQPTEFGAKVVLDKVEGGLVTRYTVCAGNPDDALSLPAGLVHDQTCFGRPPDLLAADRHFFSTENRRQADTAGVRCVALPKRGQVRPADRARRPAPLPLPWPSRAGALGRPGPPRPQRARRRPRARPPGDLVGHPSASASPPPARAATTPGRI
jgi:transposase, IS5 family